ncbi:MAG: YhcN/YlaJ family sporulation lipoprotein [Firmicutes bacterium]|nr:YhcN/YlaJ family sporulation lipoprotein [Bacillota bacterium]
MKFITGLAIAVTIFTAGCAMPNSPAPKPQAQQQQSLNPKATANTALAGQVEETAKTVASVKDGIAVVIDRDIAVAVKVTGFDRLRLKAIRQEVSDKIKKTAPDYRIHVTTDKKLFSELRKVEKQIRQGEDPALIKQKFDKINEDMHG